MNNVVTITQARKDLEALSDSVQKTGNPVIITKYGKPWVKIVPLPPK